MRGTAVVQEASNAIGIHSPGRNHRSMIRSGDLIVDLERRIVTANRPILYCAISIPYDIISKFWPIWSAGPRAAARHFALRRGGRLFLRVGCAARNLPIPITLSRF